MLTARFYKNIFFIFSFLAFFLLLNFFSGDVYNVDVFSNDLEKKEAELEGKKQEKEQALSQLEQVKQEITRIQGSGYSVDQQIRLIDAELKRVQDEMLKVEEDIQSREESISLKEVDLAEKQENVEGISEKLYKSSRYSFLEILFRQGGEDNIVQTLIFNRFVIASQISYMRAVAVEMRALEGEREELVLQREAFEKDKKDFDESKSLLAQEKAKLQGELNRQVASRGALTSRVGNLEQEISALQKVIMEVKSAQNRMSIGSIDMPPGVIDYRAQADAGSFLVFSIGAYTHRNGMSQWGAKARNEVGGQNYEQILSFYYPNTSIVQKNDLMVQINAGGTIMSFEDEYLLRLAEMPESWPLETLKAQAIAARTYAVRIVEVHGSIGVGESHQVIGGIKTGRWKEAVEQTRGMVLVNSNNNVILSEYALTHGAWVNGVGWDTRTGGFSITESWDYLAGCPWIYKPWFTVRYQSREYSCASRNYPWLNNDEMADIINTWLILYQSEGRNVDASRIISPTENACPFPPTLSRGSGNPYSLNELKALLSNPVVTIIGSPAVAQGQSGQSINIAFSTNRGQIIIPALQFVDTFNLRAPGYLQIPQQVGRFRYVFIDIQRK